MTSPAILITGAASGIGAATARALASQAPLVLLDRDAAKLEALTSGLAGAGHRTFSMDVGDDKAWAAILAEAGPLRGVVANAGIAGNGAIESLAFGEWRRILNANLDGVFLTLQAGFQRIVDGGAMVVVASASGLKAEPGIAAYGASKAGAIHLAKVAAKEGAPRGVRVNVVAPGGVETPMWRTQDWFETLVAEKGSVQAAFDSVAATATPLKRFAKPEEIADLIAYLLSDRARSMTGEVIHMDGGYVL